MGATSAIEWTEATWNPMVGCTKVSPGCDHCYAETLVNRFAGHNKGFPNRFDVMTLRGEDHLTLPLRWRDPKRIFVNSLSDLFHQDVPDEFIARVFAVMALAQRHTFQLLTKRHGRMRSLLNSERFRLEIMEAVRVDLDLTMDAFYQLDRLVSAWPLSNVWLGVSVEDQQRADLRIPALLDTPTVVRWLSCEPLLGPVDLSRSLAWGHPAHGLDYIEGIDWVVAGGESGPGARPMHPDWARSLRDQCTAAGVPFLFKQWGNWAPGAGSLPYGTKWGYLRADGTWGAPPPSEPPSTDMANVGKKAAGRELDGRTWDEYPSVAESSSVSS